MLLPLLAFVFGTALVAAAAIAFMPGRAVAIERRLEELTAAGRDREEGDHRTFKALLGLVKRVGEKAPRSPKEMGNTPAQLLASLNDNVTYRRLFKQAFPDHRGPIAEQQVFTALAAFQTSLVSLNSRYDRYVHGYDAALSDREIEGLNVFRSFVARCSECHTPPLFTNEQIAVIGMPEPAGRSFDVGAEAILHSPKLKGGFKVPTLRNIARTAPYSHSGAFDDLRGVVEFYNKGRGNAVPEDMYLYLHWHISDPKLTETEVDRIVDFLGALTDETFLPQIPARVPSGLSSTKRGE